MKKSFLILFISLFFISCDIPTLPEDGGIAGDRSFIIDVWPSGISGISYQQKVEMKLVAEGSKAIIYADTRANLDSIPASRWNDIVTEFDKYYDTLIEVYGVHTDVDKNGKVILVFHIMPIGLGGYFTSADLDKNKRNNAEIINISMNYVMHDFDLVETMDTVFHEFQHLINFYMVLAEAPDNVYESDLWLNEALSESTYFVYQNGEPNESRFPYYSQGTSSDEISKGGYFYNFGNTATPYITASMFMYWLYLHGGGSDIYEKITWGGFFDKSKLNYDYRAVVKAVKSSIPELSTADWSTILGTWFEANFVNHPSSILGYKGKYPFTPKQLTGTTSVVLPSGSAIYTSTTSVIPAGEGLETKNLGNNWQLVYNPSTTLGEGILITGLTRLPKPTTFSRFSIDESPKNRDLWVDIVRNK